MRSVLTLFVSIAILADAAASGFSLMAIFQANNPFAQVVAFFGGLLITALATLTRAVFDSRNIPFICLWIVALLIDAYTTIVAVIFFVIIGISPATPIDFSMVFYDPHNWPKTLIAFGTTGIITGMSVFGFYAIEKLP